MDTDKMFDILFSKPGADEETTMKILALAKHLEISDIEEIKKINKVGHDEVTFFTLEGRYIVCTDEEADELWDLWLTNYLDDCFSSLDKNLISYFDEDQWKEDAKSNGGRDELISGYGLDGEVEITLDGHGYNYLIYKS